MLFDEALARAETKTRTSGIDESEVRVEPARRFGSAPESLDWWNPMIDHRSPRYNATRAAPESGRCGQLHGPPIQLLWGRLRGDRQ